MVLGADTGAAAPNACSAPPEPVRSQLFPPPDFAPGDKSQVQHRRQKATVNGHADEALPKEGDACVLALDAVVEEGDASEALAWQWSHPGGALPRQTPTHAAFSLHNSSMNAARA